MNVKGMEVVDFDMLEVLFLLEVVEEFGKCVVLDLVDKGVGKIFDEINLVWFVVEVKE